MPHAGPEMIAGRCERHEHDLPVAVGERVGTERQPLDGERNGRLFRHPHHRCRRGDGPQPDSR